MISIPSDKIFHGLAGAVIAAAAFFFGVGLALVAVLAAGIAKEIYDHFTGGTVDFWDVFATCWGGSVMLGVMGLAQAYA